MKWYICPQMVDEWVDWPANRRAGWAWLASHWLGKQAQVCKGLNYGLIKRCGGGGRGSDGQSQGLVLLLLLFLLLLLVLYTFSSFVFLPLLLIPEIGPAWSDAVKRHPTVTRGGWGRLVQCSAVQ